MKIIKNILLYFFLIVIFLMIIFVYITKFKIKDVAEFRNEYNNYKIIFQSVGEPEWPFGRTKVKVMLEDDKNKKVESFKAFIKDDGAIARKENIKVNWYGDYVEVILIGGEQEDDIHKIYYD